MSWSVSEALRRAAHAQETDEAFLVLVTIEHPELEQTIRVSSDAIDTVSRGETYLAFPFDLQLPEDGEDRPPRARLTIDNVSREIVLALRRIQAAPTVTMEVVRASEPDLVEASFPFFRLQDVSYDALVVEGELGVEDLTAEPFPAARFSYAMHLPDGAAYDGDALFLPDDDALFLPEDEEAFLASAFTPFRPWPGAIEARADELIRFRIASAGGDERGIVSAFTVVFDAPDIQETFEDLLLAAEGARLPLQKTYRRIKTVNLTLQDDGGTAARSNGCRCPCTS